MSEWADDCVPLRACRGCQSTSLSPILELGETPLAKSAPNCASVERSRAAVSPAVGVPPQCGLVQIDHTVRPEILFRDYVYTSSFSPSFVEQAPTARRGAH
jgi:hypothetical protein